MKVSILIPSLNRLAYLRESLASAQAQTYREVEILVSDDGSSDGSPQFVRDVERQDPRVRLVARNPRPGIFSNINHLLGNASGDAFCVLGDDDRLHRFFVERLVRPLIDLPSMVLAFCDHQIIDASGAVLAAASEENSQQFGRRQLPHGELAAPRSVVLRGSVCLGFSLYRRPAIPAGLRFDEHCGGVADMDFAMQALDRGGFYFVKEQLGDYRVHGGTATRTRRAYMLEGQVHFLSKYSFADRSLELRRQEMLRKALRDYAFESSVLSRKDSLAAIGRYLSMGGQVAHAKLAAAVALSFCPQLVGRSLYRVWRNSQ